MNALLRIALSALPMVASIVLGWDAISQGFGQGSPAMGPSVYGLLLGSLVIVMSGLPYPLAGALASMFLAEALRLRPPAVVGVVADRWLTFAAPALYCAAAWGAWSFMWTVDRPTPTRYAPFGPSYFWTIGLVGLSLATVFGAFAMHLVTRQARPAPDAPLPSPALH